MIEPTTSVVIADIIIAILAGWAMLALGMRFPTDCKRKDYPRYTSAAAIVKIESNRRAYGYTSRRY